MLTKPAVALCLCLFVEWCEGVRVSSVSVCVIDVLLVFSRWKTLKNGWQRFGSEVVEMVEWYVVAAAAVVDETHPSPYPLLSLCLGTSHDAFDEFFIFDVAFQVLLGLGEFDNVVHFSVRKSLTVA